MKKSKLMDWGTRLLLLGVLWFAGSSAYGYYNNWVILQYDKNISSVRGAIDNLLIANQKVTTGNVAESGNIKTTGSIGMSSVSISVGFSAGPSLKISKFNKKTLLLSFYNMGLDEKNCNRVVSIVADNFDGILYMGFDKSLSYSKNKKKGVGVDGVCSSNVQDFQTTYSIKRR